MPTTYDDWPNTPLSRCKELILEYQHTRDPQTFRFLIAKFDKYLAYLIIRFRKQYKVLQGESLQELYHISIVAFHKSILAAKPGHRPEDLLIRIGSYVKYDLLAHFRYKSREAPYDNLLMERKEKGRTSKEHDDLVMAMDVAEVHKLLDSGELSKEDKEFIKMRYEKGMTFESIGKKLVVQKCSAYKRGQKVLKRVKQLFIKDIE